MPSADSSSGDAPYTAKHEEGPTHTTHMFDVPFKNNLRSETPTKNPPIEIPKITPMSTSADKHKPKPSELVDGLEGKFVDEFGNVLDWDGTVLGRVDGDLPSMIGRPVSASGEVLDSDGEIAGYVSDNYTKPTLRPLGGGLQVDEEGIIYNAEGEKVGKLNKPASKEEEEHQDDSATEEVVREPREDQSSSRDAPKPAAAPSPSEVYLDVKSTHDGIQIILKIPTIFNRDNNDRREQPPR